MVLTGLPVRVTLIAVVIVVLLALSIALPARLPRAGAMNPGEPTAVATEAAPPAIDEASKESYCLVCLVRATPSPVK